jgi:hypothetical protein
MAEEEGGVIRGVFPEMERGDANPRSKRLAERSAAND